MRGLGTLLVTMLAAAPTAAEGGAADSPPAQIIGGNPTTVGQYPSVAVLTIGGFLCTGTLIAPQWVLTAAHCLSPDGLGLMTQDQVTSSTLVHFDTVDLGNDNGTAVGAQATFVHPQYDSTQLFHDVGLIQLLSPAPLDVSPSAINLLPRYAAIGATVTFVGYGFTLGDGTGTLGVEHELRDRTSVRCTGIDAGSDDSLLCFTDPDGMGICNGDSGGPAFGPGAVAGAQAVVGITSFGGFRCGDYSASARIDAEREFILAKVPELAACNRDSDCPAEHSCSVNACVAQPFSPAGLGADCTADTDCDSGTCRTRTDGRRCSQTCSPATGNVCPDGFDCIKSATTTGVECWPSSGGCCSASGGGPGSLILGLGVLALTRRRRSSRRRR